MAEIIQCNTDDGRRMYPRVDKDFSGITIYYIDCPHQVPPGVDPEEWDALKEKISEE